MRMGFEELNAARRPPQSALGVVRAAIPSANETKARKKAEQDRERAALVMEQGEAHKASVYQAGGSRPRLGRQLEPLEELLCWPGSGRDSVERAFCCRCFYPGRIFLVHNSSMYSRSSRSHSPFKD